jgi:hypothetical protein
MVIARAAGCKSTPPPHCHLRDVNFIRLYRRKEKSSLVKVGFQILEKVFEEELSALP